MSYAPGMGIPVNGGVDGRDCGEAAAAMIDGVAKYKDVKIAELQEEVEVAYDDISWRSGGRAGNA